MQKYSMIHLPVLSFYLKDVYRDVCLHWRGTCFPYLLLLLAVCWLPPMVDLHRGLSAFIRNDAPALVIQIPQVTIKQGVATIAAPQPYTIIDPKTKKPLVILDSTGRHTSLKDTEAVGLITGTEAIIKKSATETRTYSFKTTEDLTVNQQVVNGWLETARQFTAIIFYPFAVAGAFLYRIIQVALYALLGMLFASALKTKLPYLALVRMSVVAITPGIIAGTALTMVGLTPPYAGVWFFLAAMAYLYLGIYAVSSVPTSPADDLTREKDLDH
jgi:hypothetical protein